MTDLGLQLQRVLLVRAVEERSPDGFSAEDLSKAALAAINAGDDDRRLLAQRAEFLVRRLPDSLQACASVTPLDRSWRYPVLAAMAVLGLLSNFLGPPGVILVLYNPLTALVAWNLAIYAFMVYAWMRWRVGNPIFFTPEWRNSRADRTAILARLRSDGPRSSRWLFWPIYSWWIRLRTRSEQGEIAKSYARACWETSGPAFSSRLAYLLHYGALGVVLGALAGTYARGLFLEYHAAWHSTFVTGPAAVAAMLNLVLGPASLLLDGQWLHAEAVAPLLTPDGAPAAPWIHKLAVTVAAIVVIPRMILARIAGRRAHIAEDAPRIDLSAPYYQRTIAAVREGQIKRIREGVQASVRRGSEEFAESIAQFVSAAFFDAQVKPALIAFREAGGKLTDLQQTLTAAAENIGPELAAHLSREQVRLQARLAEDIRVLIGKEPNGAIMPAGEQPQPGLLTGVALPQNVASSIADMVGTTVAGTVTAVIAAVSGGTGKSVGIAVVSHLLATTGPIGLLLGALGGLVVAGGAYTVGRERMTNTVKGWKLPAFAVAFPLRDAKIAQARQQTYTQVKDDLERNLYARSAAVTDQILQQLSLAASGTAPNK